ncbi:MAG: Crp/Fnr family transcriptional regulator [Bacteroidales bacterium]|nr:Crp/Fnr family transcriptional regulator [Bacteroidales bacterium]
MKIKNDILSCRTCVYRQLLFKDLNDFEYKLVNDERTEMLFRRGEVIKKEGEPVDSFLYLRKGLVKLYKTDSNGKDHILSINRPGDFISLLSIFSEEAYKFSIAALEETLVCNVKLDVLKHLISTNGNLSLHLFKKMSQISDEIIENQFEQAQKQVKGRVAHLLLYFANHVYHKNEFLLPLTRREMGELISITTENTIRTFSEFRKDGIIDQNGKTIKIVDYDRLLAINKGG